MVSQTDIERFATMPGWAIFKYLECFEEDGGQAFDVPRHILQALAKCFIKFRSHRSGSLDDAFGGQTRRRWQSIKTGDRNYRIALDYQREWKEARQQPKSGRTGTPSERAYSKVAELHSLKEGAVRLIVRKARRSHRAAAAAARMIQAGQMTVSEQKKLLTPIMFPYEEQLDTERFTAMPVWAIFKYLECFEEDGEQAFEVPRHILQALAKCFAKFSRSESDSLDDAFRGRIRRQRQSIEMGARDGGVLFGYWVAYDRARKQPKSERTGTPSECAYSEVAQRHGMSHNTVKAILRNAGKQPVGRKGRKRR